MAFNMNLAISPGAMAKSAELAKKPWYKLTDDQVANFNPDARAFNPGYENPYPGYGVWNGGLIGKDWGSYYAGPSEYDVNFKPNWGADEEKSGFFGKLSDGLQTMLPGLSIMALPLFAGAGAAAGGAAGEAAGAVGGEAMGSSGASIFGSSGSDLSAGGGGADTLPSMPPAQPEQIGPNYFDPNTGYSIDPNTGDVFQGSGDNPFGQSGATPSNNDFFNGMDQNSLGLLDQAKAYGQQGLDLIKQYGPALGSQLAKLLFGPKGTPTLGKGSGPLGLGGDDGLLGTAARAAPGIAALAYANKQPGIDVGPLQGILGQLGGNQDAVVRAATDPLQMNIAAGYGDILQSQAKRGIRGSSFGDTDIANYISQTGNSLANAGANAAQGSLSLQGNLAGNIAQLKNQAQQIKNNLFGKAFDVLGRGLNPLPTFNLAGP